MDRSRALCWGVLLSWLACVPYAASHPAPLDVAAFRATVLQQHNRYRATHEVPPLVLSPALNAMAQQHAEQLARTNRAVHSGNPQVGENLSTLQSSRQAPPRPEAVVDRWYSEMQHDNFTKPGFHARTGHFTQVVWKASKALGVGIAHARDGTWSVVGQYRPPGHSAGHLPTQVVPPTR
jgi:uncharacterized protein YkwD